MNRSHFIEILMILTKYVFNVGVWLTEYSVTGVRNLRGSTVHQQYSFSFCNTLFHVFKSDK